MFFVLRIKKEGCDSSFPAPLLLKFRQFFLAELEGFVAGEIFLLHGFYVVVQNGLHQFMPSLVSAFERE